MSECDQLNVDATDGLLLPATRELNSAELLGWGTDRVASTALLASGDPEF
jgi:hypothetical protein